jgi:hypothetical protein
VAQPFGFWLNKIKNKFAGNFSAESEKRYLLAVFNEEMARRARVAPAWAAGGIAVPYPGALNDLTVLRARGAPTWETLNAIRGRFQAAGLL